tara:strand:+ start:3153 stop:4022 length:870 start_codon:yes stop_codon:yes gene_type:complete
MNEDDSSISILLLDVYRGYSVFEFENQKFYVKHFSVMDMLESEEFYEESIKRAIKTGIKTEKQLLASANKSKVWTTKDEDKRSSLKWMIGKSETALEKITDNNQRNAFYKQIITQQKELEEVDEKRNSVVSYSAESLSERKKTAEMLKDNIFLDKGLSVKAEDPISPFLSGMVLSKISQMSSRSNVIKMVYSSNFFDVFVVQYRNPIAMFGGTASEMSIFQKSLLSYGHALLQKMKNTTFPDSVFGNPVKMFDYKESTKVEGKKSEGISDIKEKMAKNGGKLKAEDLLT